MPMIWSIFLAFLGVAHQSPYILPTSSMYGVMDSGGFQPLVCVGGLCVNAYGERRAEEKVKQVK